MIPTRFIDGQLVRISGEQRRILIEMDLNFAVISTNVAVARVGTIESTYKTQDDAVYEAERLSMIFYQEPTSFIAIDLRKLG